MVLFCSPGWFQTHDLPASAVGDSSNRPNSPGAHDHHCSPTPRPPPPFLPIPGALGPAQAPPRPRPRPQAPPLARPPASRSLHLPGPRGRSWLRGAAALAASGLGTPSLRCTPGPENARRSGLPAAVELSRERPLFPEGGRVPAVRGAGSRRGGGPGAGLLRAGRGHRGRRRASNSPPPPPMAPAAAGRPCRSLP
uniref:Basic proline-rich protein-like n=1 Tax=Castor canadensis TaxID=51338 RepID=A0A8B7TPD1_CASCN|nr:basic proline-rich protein-like [Castor canadensis]